MIEYDARSRALPISHTHYPEHGDLLVFFTGTGVYQLTSRSGFSDVDNDRDRAVIRAHLELALRRLDGT